MPWANDVWPIAGSEANASDGYAVRSAYCLTFVTVYRRTAGLLGDFGGGVVVSCIRRRDVDCFVSWASRQV